MMWLRRCALETHKVVITTTGLIAGGAPILELDFDYGLRRHCCVRLFLSRYMS
jgi:hypothetical protein